MQPNLKKNSPTSTVSKGWRDAGLCLFVRDWILHYNSRGLYLYPGLIRVLTEYEPLLRLLRQYFPKLKR
jgi:hypothetical protein